MTVLDIYHLIDAVAPFDTQMEGDNSGILVGSPSAPVSGSSSTRSSTAATSSGSFPPAAANRSATRSQLSFCPDRRSWYRRSSP